MHQVPRVAIRRLTAEQGLAPEVAAEFIEAAKKIYDHQWGEGAFEGAVKMLPDKYNSEIVELYNLAVKLYAERHPSKLNYLPG